MGREINPELIRMWVSAAYHEIGHALITAAEGLLLRDARLVLHRHLLGRVSVHGRVSGVNGADDTTALAWVTAAFAGPEAEALWLFKHVAGCDVGAALTEAYQGSQQDIAAIAKVCRRYPVDIEAAQHAARTMVARMWPTITTVADVLAEVGELSADDIHALAA